jgi:hypothetical protein
MGKSIDKLKCGGKPGRKSGGKTNAYQKGGKTKSEDDKFAIIKSDSEIGPNQAKTTMPIINRQQRLRGYQGQLTAAFHKKYPDVPVNELLKSYESRQPDFSRRDVPAEGEALIRKYGDLSIEPDEINRILGNEASKEFFEQAQTGRTGGPGDTSLQRFGFRNLIYPQFRSKGIVPYQYIEPKSIAENFQTGGTTRSMSALTLDKIQSIKDAQLDTTDFVSKIDQGVRTTFQPEEQNNLVTEGATGLSKVIGGGTDAIESIVSAVQDRGTKEFDPRVDPEAAMKREAGFGVGKDILKSAGKGASIGATFGPAGAAIGLAAGVITSGLKNIIGTKRRREDREEASEAFEGYWANKYFKNRPDAYQEGGKIKGPGTTKSDSITMKAREDSFIVPAENSEEGMRLGREYLGWTDKSIAERNNGGSKIKVSKGEVFYTPEEVEKLQFIGVDLNKLAPNAKPENKLRMTKTIEPMKRMTKTIKSRYQDGGFLEKEDPLMADTGAAPEEKLYMPEISKSVLDSAVAKIITNPSVKPKELEGFYPTPATASIKSTPAEAKAEAESDRGIINLFPEMASTAQVLGAIAGLSQAGKMPDLKISSRLKRLARDTQEAATYGLEPDVRNAYLREIERTRRDVMNKIVSRGGSPGEINAALGKLTSTTLEKKAQIPIMEQDMMLKKKAMNIDIEKSLAGMVYDKSRVERQDWFAYQEAWGAMLQEGLKNFIGARQYKENIDYLKSVGGTTPTFTINST